MFSKWLFGLAVLMLVAPLAVHGQRASKDDSLGREELAPIQEAARELAREVEYLQEDIVTELKGAKERTLYRQADGVLGGVEKFQRALKPNVSRDELYKAFDGLDQQLHELLKGVQALGKEQRLLQRSAARVGDADDQLHYALSSHDTSEIRTRQVLERQTRALAAAASRLDKTAEYALGTVRGRGVLVANLGKLAEAAERFQKSQASGADREQLRRDFASVNRAWERAVRGLEDLKPQESVHLLRSAGSVDRLHERLFRLLGLKGERPHLTIRT